VVEIGEGGEGCQQDDQTEGAGQLVTRCNGKDCQYRGEVKDGSANDQNCKNGECGDFVFHVCVCVCVCVCGECSEWGEVVNNLVEKVESSYGDLIFAPVFKLDKGKSAIFGMLDFEHDDRFSAVVCELKGGGGGGVGGGVGHAQRIAEKRLRRKNFLHPSRDLFFAK